MHKTGLPCLVLLFHVAALLPACSSGEDSPEKRVRMLIGRAETAAEAKDLSSLKGMLSESYSDDRGNDRQAVLGLLRYHFLRNESIHLLTRVGPVALAGPALAKATVFVAMAGEPIPSPAQIDPLRADIYLLDFTVSEEQKGTWRLIRADWRRAKAADFF